MIIFENSKKEILLYLRDDRPDLPFADHWDLIGGHIEMGESPEQALIREVKEEINLDIGLKDFNFLKKYWCCCGDVYFNIKYIYCGRINKKLSELKLGEGRRLEFFSRKEIFKLKLANINGKILANFFKTRKA